MFENIDPRSPTPLWGQIAARIRVAVAAGEFRPGESLPSVRELAKRLRVNPATVSQAYKELAREGFVETRHGSGTFIKDVGQARKALERRLRASDLVHKMLEEGARMGITGRELADAFQEEVGSKVND